MNEDSISTKTYLMQMLQDADARLRDHIMTQVAHTKDALEAAERLEKERFETARKETDLRYEAAKEATSKAESSIEKRFEQVNEFRKTLSDQATTFLPRAESDSRIAGVSSKVASLEGRLDRKDGQGIGMAAGWNFLVGAIGLISTLVAIFIMLKH